MGRSLQVVSESAVAERLDEESANPFTDEKREYRYQVSLRDGRMFHRETRIDSQGQPLWDAEHEVRYAVGAGGHGRSYLLEREGSLFLSPITWYPQRQRWALSPGYEVRNQHFTRPIVGECLYCHANFADHVPETSNRYREPIFRGHAIGCERCHGPGKLHVARHEQPWSEDFDDTIVNPRDLSPPLRDSVCQQCHLSGDLRFARRGRDLYDFRPGLPLHEIAAVFVKAPRLKQGQKITGHVEQMHQSRCFQQSGGKLGCISCHDPHSRPPASERAAWYRQRCLSCHAAEGCTADLSLRSATVPADDCISCHMPQVRTNIQHAAVSDHRVLRTPDEEAETEPPAPATSPLHLFHQDQIDLRDPEHLRDLGVALVRYGDEKPDRLLADARLKAISQLEAAVRRHPDDWDALEALAHAIWWQGDRNRSLALFERVAAARPDREFALYSAASRAQQLGQFELAGRYWQRANEVNPWIRRQHQNLAICLGEQRDWRGAEAAARRALDLFPGDGRARQLLVECLLATGKLEQAEEEFNRLLNFEPDKAAALRQWYQRHPARKAK
jgi:Tfp pilus assembly protein PilF